MSVLLSLFLKLSAFSLIAFGGVNALLPSLLNLSVNQEHWIDLQTFADYFAIAQAAPGPNFMTVTLIGWHVYGVLGALIATLAIAWPSSILVFFVQRWIMGMSDPQKRKRSNTQRQPLLSAWFYLLHGKSLYKLTIATRPTP